MCDYYGFCDVYSCAQHIEVKILANKIYQRWCAAIDKFSEYVQGEDFNEMKFNGLQNKIDKLKIEFDNIERGLDRCCGYKSRK